MPPGAVSEEEIKSLLTIQGTKAPSTLEKMSDLFRSQHKVRIRAQSIMERLAV